MKLLNLIFAFLGLLMLTAPVYANGKDKCNGWGTCSNEGEVKCAGHKHIAKKVCENGCWFISFTTPWCQKGEYCVDTPELKCTTEAVACAGCQDVFTKCVNDPFRYKDHVYQKCNREVCEAFGGRCKNECLWKC